MSYYPPTDWMLKDFYRDHADALFRCCSFLTCGQADAQKMVREIFLRMLSKGISFSSDKDARAWMMLTAYKMSKKPPLSASVPTPIPDVHDTACEADVADGADPTADILKADGSDLAAEILPEYPSELRELSRKDRLIAVFYYCEGLRRAEIAKYLGWTTFMVSHRLRRIRKKVLHEKGGEEAC